MKSYEEMTRSILERGDKYFRRKEKRIAALKKGVPIMSLFSIITVLGLGLMNTHTGDGTNPEIPKEIDFMTTQSTVQTTLNAVTETESVNSTNTKTTTEHSENTTLPFSTTAPVQTRDFYESEYKFSDTLTNTAPPHTLSSMTGVNVIVKDTYTNGTSGSDDTETKTETAAVTEVTKAQIQWEDNLEFEYTVKDDGTAEIIRPAEYKKYSKYQKVAIPSEIDGKTVTSIGEYAFSYLQELTDVSVPDTVTEIGSHAFTSCPKLKSVTLTESVTRIGERAFCACPALTDVYFPKNVKYEEFGECAFEITEWLDTQRKANPLVIVNNVLVDGIKITDSDVDVPSEVTLIANAAFCGNDAVTNVTLPEGLEVISENAFDSCCSLKNINIPGTVKEIRKSAFYHCESLENVAFAYGPESIGENAFYRCLSLREAYLPDSVTDLGPTVFYGCTNLEKVHIPENITTIPDGTFCFNSSLTDVVIPDNVTKINYAAFSNCYSITNIIIPENVKIIEHSAFDTDTLKNICIMNPDCEIIDSSATINQNAVIYGHPGSTAEEYAKRYERQFASVNDMPVTDTDPDISGSIKPSDVPYGKCGKGLQWKAEGDTLYIGIDKNYTKGSGNTSYIVYVYGDGGKRYDHMPWENFAEGIKNAVLEEGVTYISPYLFDGLDNLTHIDIPSTCTGLGSCSIPDTVPEIHITGDNVSIERNCVGPDTVIYGPKNSRADFFAITYGIKFIAEGEAEKPLWTIQGEAGPSAEWYFDTSTRTLIISGTGKIAKLYPFGLYSYVENIVVEEGITEIDDTFVRRTKTDIPVKWEEVKTVTLPDSIEKISQDLFLYLPNAINTKDGTPISEYECGTVTQPVKDPNVLYGDADLDGNVGVLDVIKITKYSMGTALLNADSMKSADVNCDGIVDTNDIVNIVLYVVKKIPSLPWNYDYITLE